MEGAAAALLGQGLPHDLLCTRRSCAIQAYYKMYDSLNDLSQANEGLMKRMMCTKGGASYNTACVQSHTWLCPRALLPQYRTTQKP